MRFFPIDRILLFAMLTLSCGLAGARASADIPAVLDMAVRSDGSILVHSTGTTVTDWRASLRDTVKHRKNPVLRLTIEPGTPFHRVAPIWEQAHFEGIKHIDLGIEVSDAIKGPNIDAALLKTGILQHADEATEPAALLAIFQKNATEADTPARVNMRVEADTPWAGLRAVLEPLVAGGVLDVMLAGRVLRAVQVESPALDQIEQSESPAELTRLADRLLTNVLAAIEKDHARLKAIRNDYAQKHDLTVDFSTIFTPADRAAREAIGQALDQPTLSERYHRLIAVERDMGTLYRELLAMRAMRPAQGREKVAADQAFQEAIVPRLHRPTFEIPVRDMSPTLARTVIAQAESARMVSASLMSTAQAAAMEPVQQEIDPAAIDMAMMDYRGPELLPNDIEFRPQAEPKIVAIPGRHVSLEKPTAEWLYPDVWYIIGPFPGDRRRTAMDRRFGPETYAQLNVQYESDRAPLAWEWHQTDPAVRTPWKVEPTRMEPYRVYYAFTEVHSDRVQKVWIALGVDDYGKLWVNDEHVWTSPNKIKPYNAMENIQPIELKQGLNKILFRFENAGGRTGFSLLLRLQK